MTKKYMSVIDGDFDLGDGKDEEKMNKAFKDTFDFIKETLGDKVDVVKATTKLKTHPVCLSSGDGITFEMEKYFTAVNPDYQNWIDEGYITPYFSYDLEIEEDRANILFLDEKEDGEAFRSFIISISFLILAQRKNHIYISKLLCSRNI